MSQVRIFIVAYDISCKKRWRHAQKILKKTCQRGQLSVFFCRSTVQRMQKLEHELRKVLDFEEDRLMIVEANRPSVKSRSFLPQNIVDEFISIESLIV